MSNVSNKLTRTLGKVKLSAIKHSPELLLAAGLISGGATIFFACKGTLKANDILDEHKSMIDDINEASEIANEDEYSENDRKKDLVKAYVTTGVSFAKTYAPAVVCGAISVGCILTSHGIMKKRNLALAATVTTLKTAYDEYRSRVVRDLGKEMDNHFLYDTVEEVVERETTDEESGKTKKKKEKVSRKTVNNAYSRFFDEANPNWEKDGASNFFFIDSQRKYLQQKLIRDGYLFLNDVYKALGLPITIAGQSAGWIYDFDNKTNTMFDLDGFGDSLSDDVRALMNGYERNVLLSFVNLQPSIIDDLPRIDGEIMAI